MPIPVVIAKLFNDEQEYYCYSQDIRRGVAYYSTGGVQWRPNLNGGIWDMLSYQGRVLGTGCRLPVICRDHKKCIIKIVRVAEHGNT